MERDEKLEKQDSSERNSGEGRRDDVDDAALRHLTSTTAPPPENQELRRDSANTSTDAAFKNLDQQTVDGGSAAPPENQEDRRRNSGEGRRDDVADAALRHLTSTTAPPPENQELRRDSANTSTDAAFKNLDQQTVDGGSAAPPENQEDRRRNSGEGRRDDVADAVAALLPENLGFGPPRPPIGLNLNHEEVSSTALYYRIYPRHLTSTSAPPPENQELRRDTADTSTDAALKNLGIGNTATTAPPTTTTVASNLPPPLQNQNTVSTLLKLQAGIFDFGVLQKRIKANHPFQLMTATVEALLGDPIFCKGGCSSFEVTAMGGWKEAFEQCCNEERSRVDRVTTECNARKNIQMSTQEVDAMQGRYVVVTILVSVQGEHELPIINSWEDMETALDKLASIPSDSANDTKVMWSPEIPFRTLSDTELLESYPSIKLFDNVDS